LKDSIENDSTQEYFFGRGKMFNKFKGDTEKPSPGLETFVVEFLSDRQKELVEVYQFVKVKNFEALQKTAHKWKGFSEPYGFGGLGVVSVELERAAQECSIERCAELVQKADQYLQEKSISIKEQRKQ